MTAPDFHPLDHIFRDEVRGSGPRDQYRPYQQVGVPYGAVDIIAIRHYGKDVAMQDLVQVTQPIRALVDNSDMGTHADGDEGRIQPNDSSPDDYDLRGGPPGLHPAECHDLPSISP